MSNSVKPPIWFWIVGVLGLLWNGMGVSEYLKSAGVIDWDKSNYTTEQLAYMDAYPAWVTALFAVAVFGGLLGCLALLMRKKWATQLFGLSLLAVLGQQIYQLFLSDGPALMGNSLYMWAALIIGGAVALFLLSQRFGSKGYLN